MRALFLFIGLMLISNDVFSGNEIPSSSTPLQSFWTSYYNNSIDSTPFPLKPSHEIEDEDFDFENYFLHLDSSLSIEEQYKALIELLNNELSLIKKRREQNHIKNSAKQETDIRLID